MQCPSESCNLQQPKFFNVWAASYSIAGAVSAGDDGVALASMPVLGCIGSSLVKLLCDTAAVGSGCLPSFLAPLVSARLYAHRPASIWSENVTAISCMNHPVLLPFRTEQHLPGLCRRPYTLAHAMRLNLYIRLALTPPRLFVAMP